MVVKGLRTILVFLGASILTVSPLTAGKPQSVKIKLATLAPNGSPWHLILQEMGQKWWEESDGEVKLTVYPNGVAGDESAVVRKMRIRQLNAATISTAGLSLIEPGFSALTHVPLLYNSYEEMDYVREQLADELSRQLEEKGFILLHWGEAGWVRFFSQEAISVPDDLKSQKLFVWGDEATDVTLWKSMGFQPVPLAATDIMIALQTGMINAFDTTPLLALRNQWFASTKYMASIRWAPLQGATIISKNVWEQISEPMRESILSGARETAVELRSHIREVDQKAIEVMQDYGLVINEVSEDDYVVWEKTVKEIYPYIRSKIVPENMFDRVIKLRDEYRNR